MLIVNIIAAFVSARETYRRYRQARRELMRLNDHELSELGITRHDVVRIARESALRPRRLSAARP